LGIIPGLLPLVSGALRGERWRAVITVLAPARERPLPHIARPARLVHTAQLRTVLGESIEVPPQPPKLVRNSIDLPGRRRVVD